MSYQMTKAEMETIINFDEEVNIANVYTYNIAMENKLSKLSDERPGEVKQLSKNEWEVPKRWVKISPPKNYSPEQLEKMKALAKANLSKQS